MKKARQIALSYGSLRKAIAGELMAGAERVRRAYREELERLRQYVSMGEGI